MNETNLPAPRQATQRMGPSEERLVPGSWWRLAGPAEAPAGCSEQVAEDFRKANEIAERIRGYEWADPPGAAPEHGILLMLSEVRIVDDEIHTLILHSHPGWKHGRETRILSEHFALIMTEAPDGPELRQREEDVLSGRIAQMTARMSDPPDQADLAARVQASIEKQAKKEAADAPEGDSPTRGLDAERMSQVPAVLLPSRDIVEAERQVRREVAKAEALGEIMQERVEKVNEAMAVTVRYKSETAHVAMSRISGRLEQAKKTMTNVHTLKLWIGEGVDIHPLTEGKGAAGDAKIHFMQQMLYLDEEIFVQSMSEDGLTHDNLSELPKLFEENPAFVQRMMPYERCVAIARVRRRDRDLPFSRDIDKVMAAMAQQKADRRIFIFTRDGDRVSMIVADEETSGAKRLFPSDREIDGIYTSNHWNDRGAQMDVADVRYSDARRSHEARALFYKRFLLILWGAHEREGIFGALPRGLNWLTAETHMTHFSFVHDEESGIAVDRKPVLEWIKEHNARLRPGSRVVANYASLFHEEERVPGAWSNPMHREPEKIRSPVTEWGDAFVAQRGDDLVIAIPSKKSHYWAESSTTKNVNAILTRPGRKSWRFPDNAMVIDDMTSAEMEAYIDSRKERQSYRHWMHEMSRALPLVREREEIEAKLIARIEDSAAGRALSEGARGMLPRAAHEAVLAANWTLPEEKIDARVIRMATSLAAAQDMRLDGAAQVRILPSSDVQILKQAEPLLDPDLADPLWDITATRLGKSGNILGTSQDMRSFDRYPRTGTVLLHDATDEDWVDRAGAGRSAIKTPDDREVMGAWLDKLATGSTQSLERLGVMMAGRDIIDPEEIIQRIFDESGDYVIRPMDRIVLAPVIAPDVRADRLAGSTGVQFLTATSDPIYRLWLRGDEASAKYILRKTHAKPEKSIIELERRAETGKPAISVGLSAGRHREGLCAILDQPELLNDWALRTGNLEIKLRGEEATIERDYTDTDDLAGMIAFTTADPSLGNQHFGVDRKAAEEGLQEIDKIRLLFPQAVADLILEAATGVAPRRDETPEP